MRNEKNFRTNRKLGAHNREKLADKLIKVMPKNKINEHQPDVQEIIVYG
jgi:hypothetical protein